MLGIRINEFDNSDGTIEAFNKLFPCTPLDENPCASIVGGNDCVEILGITDNGIFPTDVYIRDIKRGSVITSHDFGYNNFEDNVDFAQGNNIRFKYFVRDLDGEIIATAYNFKELSEKMGCSENMLKKRIKETIDKTTTEKHKWNVKRIKI